jgi:hypothetical protein
MRYTLLISFLFLLFILACTKEKENKRVYLSGRYKMVTSYVETPNDSGLSITHLDEFLISRYLEFVDSNTVFISDTIGFPGMVPVTVCSYKIENNTFYVDSAWRSPFRIWINGNIFTIESKASESGTKNRFSR